MIALFWALATTHASIPHSQPAIQVRVRLAHQLHKMEIRGFDLKFSFKGKTYASRQSSLWSIECGDLIWMFQKKPYSQSKTRSPVTLSSPAGFISLNGKSYRGDLTIYPKSCDVVNQVELEHYLASVLNAEFSARWNPQAVDAQVIAARTYAYHQVKKRGNSSHFDLESNEKDQLYQGASLEDHHSAKAVLRTAGLVLTHPKGELLEAFYHSTCGGITETPQAVWGGAYPSTHQAVRCPYCKGSPSHRWSLRLSLRDIENTLANHSHPPKGQFLKKLEFWVNPRSRVEVIEAHWWNPKNHQIFKQPLRASTFRLWVGPARLKSTLFKAKKFQNTYFFEGLGHGHGVGLCQWGAKTMGEKGAPFQKILSFYYPGCLIRSWRAFDHRPQS